MNFHGGLMQASREGLMELSFRVPKNIAAGAKTAIEAEGYTVTHNVIAGASYDEFLVDWSAP